MKRSRKTAAVLALASTLVLLPGATAGKSAPARTKVIEATYKSGAIGIALGQVFLPTAWTVVPRSAAST